MQNVDVAVHMQEQVVTGVVSLPPEERLSDFLNSDFNTQSDSSGRFLKLTDAIIDSADGIKQRGGTIYVNKEAIRILRTLETDSARGIGAKDVPKKHPFVHKLSVRATIRLSGFEVNGYLHCTNEEEILELLTKELSFLPCTDAKIHGISEDYSWKASFVAINRKQVCTIQFSQ